MIEIEIVTANVLEVECDVLILKYAQGLHGADREVVDALRRAGRDVAGISPKPRERVLVDSSGALQAARVLFVGVVPIDEFEYSEIREFTKKSIASIPSLIPTARRVAMTMHGVLRGLDERESFLAQLGGIFDAALWGTAQLRVSIVERDPGRAARLRELLSEALRRVSASQNPSNTGRDSKQEQAITAGVSSGTRPRVFVAMPFSKELEDVYVFGIQSPVNSAGYLCERMDMVSFTGDILDRVKSRIESAELVVADLTGANPNVYLEVGYAWGKGRPTLLLAKKAETLMFDVRGQRCIVYENIVDLAKRLEADLASLERSR